MKKLSLFIAVLLCGNLAFSQQLFVEAFSGYNLTAYDLQEYDPTGYVPIGFRVAGGHEHVQLGVEYRQNITNPEFTFEGGDPLVPILREEFEETYIGGFIRGNLSSLPAYRFGLVLKAGAGYYNTKRSVYDLPSDVLQREATFEYDKKLGYNVGIGISAPIWTLLHWEIGYQFNAVERDEVMAQSIPGYKAYYHSFQMGLSLNMVFGNTAKKCRRVISSGRR